MALKMPAKPVGRQIRDRFQGAGLFKEMRRAGQDLELLLAVKFRKRFLIQPDHYVVISTYDE